MNRTKMLSFVHSLVSSLPWCGLSICWALSSGLKAVDLGVDKQNSPLKSTGSELGDPRGMALLRRDTHSRHRQRGGRGRVRAQLNAGASFSPGGCGHLALRRSVKSRWPTRRCWGGGCVLVTPLSGPLVKSRSRLCYSFVGALVREGSSEGI